MKITQEQLVKKAIELFRQHGYDGVSVAQICQACNVTKGSFYHHFSSKKDILECFLKEIAVRGQAQATQLEDCATFKERIWLLIESTMSPTIELGVQGLYAMMVEVVLPGYGLVEQQTPMDKTGLQTSVIGLTRQAKEHQELHNPNSAEDMWFAYKSGVYGIAFHWSISNGNYNKKTELKRLFDIIYY